MTDENGPTQERPSQVNIRPATKADLPFIERVLRSTVQTPYGSGNVDEDEVQMDIGRINKSLDSSKDELLIAETGEGQGLGFAFFGSTDPRILAFAHSDSATTLELRLLYLNQDQRNKGTGSRLLDAVEGKAKDLGMHRIELTTGPRYFLIGSGVFYSKKGYRKVGTIPNYFEGKYPAWVFQKDL